MLGSNNILLEVILYPPQLQPLILGQEIIDGRNYSNRFHELSRAQRVMLRVWALAETAGLKIQTKKPRLFGVSKRKTDTSRNETNGHRTDQRSH